MWLLLLQELLSLIVSVNHWDERQTVNQKMNFCHQKRDFDHVKMICPKPSADRDWKKQKYTADLRRGQDHSTCIKSLSGANDHGIQQKSLLGRLYQSFRCRFNAFSLSHMQFFGLDLRNLSATGKVLADLSSTDDTASPQSAPNELHNWKLPKTLGWMVLSLQ